MNILNCARTETVDHKCRNVLCMKTLNHESITKHAQNVCREPQHKQRDGDTTDWWLQQPSNGPAFSI